MNQLDSTVLYTAHHRGPSLAAQHAQPTTSTRLAQEVLSLGVRGV